MAGGRAPTSGRRCSATTGPRGRRRAPAPGAGLREGELGVRRPLRRADPAPSAAGGAACRRRAARDRPGVLAGRTADPRAVAGPSAESPTSSRCTRAARSSTSRMATRRPCSASPTVAADRRFRRVRLRLPGRHRPGALPRAAARDGGDRRVPGAHRGLRDVGAGLYITGFASTRDFGPFYGFTKGCPSSASLAVADMLRRGPPGKTRPGSPRQRPRSAPISHGATGECSRIQARRPASRRWARAAR